MPLVGSSPLYSPAAAAASVSGLEIAQLVDILMSYM
jgi:hypothetical protein